MSNPISEDCSSHLHEYCTPCECSCHTTGTGGKVKIKRKFYVASRATVENSDGRNWGKETKEEAIEHATELCEETEKAQYIVQVIAIVKPTKTPVTIEDVE